MDKPRPIAQLNKKTRRLLNLALKAQRLAYAPYSGFTVGACLLDSRDKLHTGCNVENVSLSATVCAERVALWKMISEGSAKARIMVIVNSSKKPAFPCGECLQVLQELAKKTQVFAVNWDATLFQTATVEQLLPLNQFEQIANLIRR